MTHPCAQSEQLSEAFWTAQVRDEPATPAGTGSARRDPHYAGQVRFAAGFNGND